MAYHAQVKAPDLEKQARYLMSVACLVKDAEIHDRLQQEVKRLTDSDDLRQLSHKQLDLSD